MEIFPGGSGLSPSKEVNKGDIILYYEVVVATSAMICKKGLLPTPELALFRRLYLTLD